MEDRYLKEEIMEKRYRVTLTDEERAELSSMVSKGKSNARKLVRARILLLADQAAGGSAKSDPEIVEALGSGAISINTHLRKKTGRQNRGPSGGTRLWFAA